MENRSRRMAHGDPRPERSPSSREQQPSFFFALLRIGENKSYAHHTTTPSRIFIRVVRFFLRGSSGTMLLTSLNFVELVKLYTLRPPEVFNFQARPS